jgi:hypothetical protein
MRTRVCLLIAALPALLAAQTTSCPVLQSGDPSPAGWYGDGNLRVALHGGVWYSLPRWNAAQIEKGLGLDAGSLPWRKLTGWVASYRQVITWTWDGYDARTEPQPPLMISGRRLDAPAPPMLANHPSYGNGIAGNPSVVTSGGFFPTDGCWEVTGKVHDHELKFVIFIGPSDRFF